MVSVRHLKKRASYPRNRYLPFVCKVENIQESILASTR